MSRFLRLHSGFTISELLVVFVVLSILSVISFTSYAGFVANARDGNRRWDIGSIKSQLYERKQRLGVYPLPSDTFRITNSWAEVAVQGWLDKKVKIQDNTTIPYDPKIDHPYGYSVLSSRLAYQLATTLETPSTKALIDGSFKTPSPKTMPSLFLAYSGTSDMEINESLPSGLINQKLFIVDGMNTNFLYDMDGNVVARNTLDLTGMVNSASFSIPADSSYTNCKSIYEAGLSLGAWIYNTTKTTGAAKSNCYMVPPYYAVSDIPKETGTSYASCTGTTNEEYNFPTTLHGNSISSQKSYSNGSGSMTATCANWVFTFSSARVNCEDGYFYNGVGCSNNSSLLCTNAPTGKWKLIGNNEATNFVFDSNADDGNTDACGFVCQAGSMYKSATNECIENSWNVIPGTCSVACWGGAEYRTITCQDYTGSILSDALCLEAKPASAVACNTFACIPGVCWSSNGWYFATAPSTDLCNTGTPSIPTTGAFGYSWTCASSNWWATKSCSARKMNCIVEGVTKEFLGQTYTLIGSPIYSGIIGRGTIWVHTFWSGDNEGTLKSVYNLSCDNGTITESQSATKYSAVCSKTGYTFNEDWSNPICIEP